MASSNQILDIDVSFKAVIGSVVFLAYIMSYFVLYAKAVQNVCMVKEIPIGKLTEGDWLVSEVKLGKKTISASKTGLDSEDIALIKKSSVKNVVVKEGMPFLPGFLLAYIFTLIVGNWLVVFFI